MSTKSQSASRDCNIYGSEANANFCDSCKLDCLKKAKKAKAKPVADEDDYSISEEEIFSKAFEDTGERIMTVTKSPAGTIAVCVAVIIVAALVFVTLQKRREQKEKERRQMEDILKTPLEKFGDQDVENLAKKYEQDSKPE